MKLLLATQFRRDDDFIAVDDSSDAATIERAPSCSTAEKSRIVDWWN